MRSGRRVSSPRRRRFQVKTAGRRVARSGFFRLVRNRGEIAQIVVIIVVVEKDVVADIVVIIVFVVIQYDVIRIIIAVVVAIHDVGVIRRIQFVLVIDQIVIIVFGLCRLRGFRAAFRTAPRLVPLPRLPTSLAAAIIVRNI